MLCHSITSIFEEYSTLHVFRRRSVYLCPIFLPSCSGVTIHVLDNKPTENVGHLNASFVILLHIIKGVFQSACV